MQQLRSEQKRWSGLKSFQFGPTSLAVKKFTIIIFPLLLLLIIIMIILILILILIPTLTIKHFNTDNSRLADTPLLQTLAITDKIQIPIYRGLTKMTPCIS